MNGKKIAAIVGGVVVVLAATAAMALPAIGDQSGSGTPTVTPIAPPENLPAEPDPTTE